MIFQHHRFQIWGQSQHPYKHSLAEFSYTNPALPTDQPQNAESAMNWLFAVLYPQTQASVDTPGDLPAVGNTINDYRVVLDDGDGKAAAYRWEQREGDATPKWYKVYDMDWGEQSILSNFLLKTQDVYVYKHGIDDLDDSGSPLVGDNAGQFVYGGATAGSHLTLYANSGDGVGPGTGYVQVGDNFRPKVDNTYSSGTATYRWSHVYTVLATVDTMSLSSGNISDTTGSIDYNNTSITNVNLFDANRADIDNIRIDGNTISNTVNNDNININTLGTGEILVNTNIRDDGAHEIFFNNATIDNQADLGNLRINGNTISRVLGSNININAAGGDINMQSAMFTLNQTVTGYVDITGHLEADNIAIGLFDTNTISSTNTNGNINLMPDGTGVVNVSTSLVATVGVTGGNLRLVGNSLLSINTDGDIAVDPDGTGDIVLYADTAPSVDDSFDLGTSTERWSELYLSDFIGDGTNTISVATMMSFRNANTGVAIGDTLFWSGTEWLPSAPDSEIDHGTVNGLGDDDHTQYALLLGRAGGQTLIGGTAANDNLTLSASSNATDGNIIFTSVFRPDDDNLTDIGANTNRIRDLYLGGQGFGFRMENAATVGALPSPSASTPGRIAFVTGDQDAYVDTGGTWVKMSAEKYVEDDASGWTGAVTQVVYTVNGAGPGTGSITDARRAIWVLYDNANNFREIAGATFSKTATQVTVDVGVPLPTGTYRLVGIG